MAQLHIQNIVVQNNPSSILSPFQFEITFECFKHLPGTFDWKIIYLGSPKDSSYDQVIDQFDMSDLQPGVMTFNTDSNAPDFGRIPQEEILGTSAVLLSVLYEGQEFFRVGYYIVNEYEDPTLEQIPQVPLLEKVKRTIIGDKPRIMRFQIEWNKQEGNPAHNTELLNQNLQVIGGDPFQQSNGVFEQLDKASYSYGMFGPGAQL